MGRLLSALLPRCSSLFIYARMWCCRVCQPPPCGVCKLQPSLPHSTICHLTGSTNHCLAVSPLRPGCISPPLLPVWMNVSSLSPWLLDFHTIRFSVSSGCFLFLNFCCLLVVRGGTVCIPTHKSWLEAYFLFLIVHCWCIKMPSISEY